jgi:hypothetical protein
MTRALYHPATLTSAGTVVPVPALLLPRIASARPVAVRVAPCAQERQRWSAFRVAGRIQQ